MVSIIKLGRSDVGHMFVRMYVFKVRLDGHNLREFEQTGVPSVQNIRVHWIGSIFLQLQPIALGYLATAIITISKVFRVFVFKDVIFWYEGFFV